MIRIHAAVYNDRSQEPLFPAALNARLRRCPQHPDRQRLLRMMAWSMSWIERWCLLTDGHYCRCELNRRTGTARRVGAVKSMRGPEGMIPVGLMVRWLP